MAGTANRLLENATLVDRLVGPEPEVIRHDPPVRTLPCLNLVLVVPDVLGVASGTAQRLWMSIAGSSWGDATSPPMPGYG
jgi:hypothetical protein